MANHYEDYYICETTSIREIADKPKTIISTDIPGISSNHEFNRRNRVLVYLVHLNTGHCIGIS